MSIEKKPPKFEEAIFRLDGEETLLARDEITKLRIEEPEKFMRDVKYNLFCPGCGGPHLKHNNANTPYLSTHQNEAHDEECPMACEELDEKTCNEYFGDIKNSNAIHRRLSAVVAKLFETGLKENNPLMFYGNGDYQKPDEQPTAYRVRLVGRLIPHQLINQSFRDDDYNVYKIFYGKKVFVKWTGNSWHFNLAPCWTRNPKSVICSVEIPIRARDTFTEQFPEGSCVNVAFSAEMVKSQQGYLDAKLLSEKSIVIAKV